MKFFAVKLTYVSVTLTTLTKNETFLFSLKRGDDGDTEELDELADKLESASMSENKDRKFSIAGGNFIN
jgi:hypothetical protein